MNSKNLLVICLAGLFAISFFNFFQYAQAASAPEARWEKTFFSRFDRDAAPVMQTDDEGYLVVGAGTWGDQVVKFNQDGVEVWNKTFDGTFLSIQQISDNEFILAGHKIGIVV